MFNKSRYLIDRNRNYNFQVMSSSYVRADYMRFDYGSSANHYGKNSVNRMFFSHYMYVSFLCLNIFPIWVSRTLF